MPTARQAPEFTLRSGPGLALIDDLRRLRDWYLALCRHRQIVAEDVKKENNLTMAGAFVDVPDGDPNGIFNNVLVQRGSTYFYDGSGDTEDLNNYYVDEAPWGIGPLAPTYSRHRGGRGPGTSLYNHPPSSPRDRPPYQLPRKAGLVRKSELLDFKTWATAPGLDTATTAPPAPPAKPKPAGLATRADLSALAAELAA